VEAQYRTRRQAYLDGLGEQQAVLAKAREDLASAREVKAALENTLPVLVAQDEGWQQLVEEGYASKLLALEKKRARMEKEGELKAQNYAVASLAQSIAQSEQRIAQITSTYRSQLLDERVEAQGQLDRLQQQWAKQSHRQALLELRAPQAGMIKDLSTHTLGSVVQPGTVLMTLVPVHETMLAEVWVSNADAGSIEPQQPVKVKLAPYPFQKYGMLAGRVQHLSPDASERPEMRDPDNGTGSHVEPAPLHYRALVALDRAYLERDGVRFKLSPGMRVSAEINLGSRTVLEYLLSPVQKTVREAGRER
jgi:hemolysin D